MSTNRDIAEVFGQIATALELLDAGRILNLNAVVTLQWLALNRSRLRAAWRPTPSI